MSRVIIVLVCALLLGVATVSLAQEPVEYGFGGMVDPYAGPTPSGMRFGDGAQVVTVQTGDGGEMPYPPSGCSQCRGGIPGAPCDPAWGGPCLDWKQVGWYSSWHDKNHGCGKAHGCGRACGSCRCQSCCY